MSSLTQINDHRTEGFKRNFWLRRRLEHSCRGWMEATRKGVVRAKWCWTHKMPRPLRMASIGNNFRQLIKPAGPSVYRTLW